MSSTTLFSKSLQKTDIWLKDAARELNWKDQHKTYTALRSVLHALRDRMTTREAVQLGAQLPSVIRGFYYDGWTMPEHPFRDRTKYGFLSQIQNEFGKVHDGEIDTARVASAILRVLNARISEGEIDDIRAILPRILAEFWPVEQETHTLPIKANKTGTSSVQIRRGKVEHTAEELSAAAAAGSRAVIGLVRTLKALNEDMAWKVMIGERVRLTGFECYSCAALFAVDRESCSYCAGTLRPVDNMTRRIVEYAREHGIEVQILRGDSATGMSAIASGIGAFLKKYRR